MGTDFRSMLFPQHPNVQSPHVKSSELPFNLELQNIGVGQLAPATRTSSIHGAVPAFGLPTKLKEPQHGWFYCLPRFRLGFNAGPSQKATIDGKLIHSLSNPGKKIPLTSKQFLVFDQSGEKTTFIYSSEIGTTPLCFDDLNSKPLPVKYHSNNSGYNRKFQICNEIPPHSGPNLTDDACIQSAGGGEMQEDTEEINALLYSDDDVDEDEKNSNDGGGDDDEVTSTAHSLPFMSTAYNHNDKSVHRFDDHVMVEEVASSFDRPMKRVKTSHGSCDACPSLTDAPSFAKMGIRSFSEYEDDAESACGNGESFDYDEIVGGKSFDYDEIVGFSSALKDSRKERIRDTVSVLQSIIPGVKGKDSLEVIDEAIHYLRLLRVKAKSLGLATPS